MFVSYPKRLFPAHGMKQVYSDNWEDSLDYNSDVYIEIREEAYRIWLEDASHTPMHVERPDFDIWITINRF